MYRVSKLTIFADAKEAGIKSGDKVVYKKYSGTEMEWNGNEYLLLKSEDIQAKIK